ncbi:MAG: EAL domain-containing protein [Rhodoferax sp.]
MIDQFGRSQHNTLHLLSAVLVLLTFVGMLGLELWSSRESALAQAEAELAVQADLLATHVGDRIARIDQVLVQVARLYPDWQRRKDVNIDHELATLLKQIPDSQSLRIGNAQGQIVFDASGKLPSGSIFDRDYVRRLRTDPGVGLVISEPIFARFTHNWVITLSRRLAEPNPAFIGHVQGAINAAQFEKLFAHLVRNPGDMVALYDREIRLVSRAPAVPEQLGKRVGGTQFQNLIALGQVNTHYQATSPLDGYTRHYALRQVPGHPLFVLVGRTEADILRSWTTKAQVYSVTSVVLALALAAFLWAWQRNYQLALRFGDRMAHAAQDAEARARNLLDSLPDAAWLRDTEGRFLAVNQAYLELCGRPMSAVIGHTLEDVWPPDLAQRLRDQDQQMLQANAPRRDDTRLRGADGQMRYIDTSRHPLRNAAGTVVGVAGLTRDVTALVEAKQRAEDLVRYDPLTRLPNWTWLSQTLKSLFNPAAGPETPTLALMLLDVDHFQHINDSLGHAVGDRLLQEVATRLLSVAVNPNWVARRSGDEFGLLVSAGNDHVITLAHRAQQILDVLAQPMVLNGHTLHITASIGLSLYPDDGPDLDHLLRQADAALHEAKDQGRNAYCFYRSDMNQRMAQRLALEERLRQALAAQEFVLHYQPKVDPVRDSLAGTEALVRWIDPQRGLVAPGQFIPVAEASGLIKPLGLWVLNAACQQAAQWQSLPSEPGAGTPLPVAVNLSAVQLADPHLLQQVQQALQTHGLRPQGLVLEITESMLMRDIEASLQTLNALHQMGVGISLDDFGTGYSSFAYLKRLPVDEIKIDRSFVTDLGRDPRADALVRGMIGLALQLGLRVVAEGAETAEQVALLRSMGCQRVQGFFYSAAQPADALASWRPSTPG